MGQLLFSKGLRGVIGFEPKRSRFRCGEALSLSFVPVSGWDARNSLQVYMKLNSIVSLAGSCSGASLAMHLIIIDDKFETVISSTKAAESQLHLLGTEQNVNLG
jgi:hypothetical protein